ncbi:hypothetical protein CEN43_07895 [Fischerella thermalis BR2B]|jgi:transposase-like protein|uniref:Transposase n=1 Tax=Fischerella thermalis JSC-11 TaxID=741277 RepID=G6FW45_9CYAN|nr:hypothetical protein FJSC11DRAFT_3136 [Fischerella thermalis JSC-11]PMB06840.1 hypothetical protein CI592_10100 [Fischerella thermalis CCMEE 5328]PMB34313.1 hypothetical protein CEN43_07895 [Fischerella thermalis BR2B]PMB37843.1 hypothetical protein CEN42_00835 [Fischerella thermalis CCMEE 5208]
MECPRCASTHIRKNGKQRGKQDYICVKCGRQFIDASKRLLATNQARMFRNIILSMVQSHSRCPLLL